MVSEGSALEWPELSARLGTRPRTLLTVPRFASPAPREQQQVPPRADPVSTMAPMTLAESVREAAAALSERAGGIREDVAGPLRRPGGCRVSSPFVVRRTCKEDGIPAPSAPTLESLYVEDSIGCSNVVLGANSGSSTRILCHNRPVHSLDMPKAAHTECEEHDTPTTPPRRARAGRHASHERNVAESPSGIPSGPVTVKVAEVVNPPSSHILVEDREREALSILQHVESEVRTLKHWYTQAIEAIKTPSSSQALVASASPTWPSVL